MSLFSFDSPFMRFLGKAVEYMLTCLLCLVFCLPIFTIGAALTAKYYVGLKLYRGEDTSFFRDYVRSFKENFKQTTLIWIIEVAVGGLLALDWYLIYTNGGDNYNLVLRILLVILTVYFVMAGLAIFALISRFEMTTKEAVKGALAYTYVNIPRMIFIVILTVLPTAAGLKHFNWFMPIWPVGQAVCLYLICFYYSKSFQKLELHVLGEDEEEKEEKDEETGI